MFPLRNFLMFAVAGAIFALSAATHSPYAQTFVALSAPTTPANADEMVQNLGPVGPHEPIITTFGDKRVIAFYVPGNGACNVQAVIWNVHDADATTAAGLRVSLNPAQTASINGAENKSLILKCGDYAEALSAIDSDRQVASK